MRASIAAKPPSRKRIAQPRCPKTVRFCAKTPRKMVLVGWILDTAQISRLRLALLRIRSPIPPKRAGVHLNERCAAEELSVLRYADISWHHTVDYGFNP